jgi:hypothetical protein
LRGLVFEPPKVTSELNGWADRKREGQAVDADVMLTMAFDAYEKGELVLVVDDEQAGEIDSELVLSDGSTALFRKSVPLIVPQLRKGRTRKKGSAHESYD